LPRDGGETHVNIKQQPTGPQGGLQAHVGALRRWRWDGDRRLLSEPVRCKREQWYLARGRLARTATARDASLHAVFLRADQPVSERSIRFDAIAEADPCRELLGWVQAPEDATHLQLCLPDTNCAGLFDEVVFHPVAERDPKCHPAANVPRWRTYRPPFPIERVVLPDALEPLAAVLAPTKVERLASPRSARQLADRLRGAAGVLDPDWVRRLRLTLADVERLAAQSWLIIDLQTLAALVNRAGAATTRVVAHTAPHDIMSARVEYADVATRGFALQDVVPFSTLDAAGDFRMRVLAAGRSWKRYAENTAFATLLASETPWESKCGDVVSAARPFERGELLATDLPWLVAGQHGRLLAPRLARHSLRMHLGGQIEDYVQYWNRWDEDQVIVRDIADLHRRCPLLRPVRWASSDPALAHLGVTLPPTDAHRCDHHLIIRTGRIDNRTPHDGLSSEPMIIFMKWLAREAAERTDWAARHLTRLRVTWQFDSAAGLRYVVNYASAAGIGNGGRETVVRVRPPRAAEPPAPDARNSGAPAELILAEDVGVFGDGSLAFQSELAGRLRGLIEHCGR
jgi:hypothetical protein